MSLIEDCVAGQIMSLMLLIEDCVTGQIMPLEEDCYRSDPVI